MDARIASSGRTAMIRFRCQTTHRRYICDTYISSKILGPVRVRAYHEKVKDSQLDEIHREKCYDLWMIGSVDDVNSIASGNILFADKKRLECSHTGNDSLLNDACKLN